MTAMKDAMNKAGINTAVSQLYTEAVKCLQKPSTAHKAFTALLMGRDDLLAGLVKLREDILSTLTQDYLAGIAGDMGLKWQPTQRAPTPSSKLTTKQSDAAKQPQASTETITVGPYDRRAKNTTSAITRRASVAAWMTATNAIFSTRVAGRELKEISFAEVGKLLAATTDSAARQFEYTTKDVRESILLRLIHENAPQVPDQSWKIPQGFSADEMQALVDRATKLTPDFVLFHAQQYRKDLRQGELHHVGAPGNN